MAARKEHVTGETAISLARIKKTKDQPVLEPLCFPEFNSKAKFSIPLFCFLCDKMFKDVGMGKSDALLHHLLVEHQFVIADVDLIADFKSYVHYWKKRFRESPMTDFCSVININSKAEDIGPKLQYNLLCDGLPEDKQLREQLQIKKLQGILQLQQEERTDSHFSRNCLFCNLHFEGNRSVLFQHMVDNHAFNVGLPDNLVYVDELLNKLEEKITNLQCLFCDKTFKDRPTLKDHMRKKQHKKINPKNKEFDKYYLINYLEVGKNWHDILDEDDREINQKSRYESWEDWQEESIPIHCLFCEVTSPDTQGILTHMKVHAEISCIKECHSFDLLKIKKNQGLNFYEEVKIVNYIRRQVYNCKCIFCKEKFNSKETLLRHLNEMCHFELPEKNLSWDQPHYFFPTFENDGLLCGLPDDDEDECSEEICENDGGVEAHVDEEHSPYGTNLEQSQDVNNENNDGVNICKNDDDDSANNNGSDGDEVCDHGVVGKDKQPDDNYGSNDCGNENDGKLGRKTEHDARNELKHDLPAVLVNNGADGENDVDYVGDTQNKNPDKTDGVDESVDYIGNENDNHEVCDDVSDAAHCCDKVDDDCDTKLVDDTDDRELHGENNSCGNMVNDIRNDHPTFAVIRKKDQTEPKAEEIATISNDVNDSTGCKIK